MKNLIRRIGFVSVFTTMSVMITASTALAQFAGPVPAIPGTPGPAGLTPATFRTLLIGILQIVLNFLALVAVIVIIIAGIRLIVSQGNEEQRETAKKTILYALIGLIVILFARVIVGLVTVFLAGEVSTLGT